MEKCNQHLTVTEWSYTSLVSRTAADGGTGVSMITWGPVPDGITCGNFHPDWLSALWNKAGQNPGFCIATATDTYTRDSFTVQIGESLSFLVYVDTLLLLSFTEYNFRRYAACRCKSTLSMSLFWRFWFCPYRSQKLLTCPENAAQLQNKVLHRTYLRLRWNFFYQIVCGFNYFVKFQIKSLSITPLCRNV